MLKSIKSLISYLSLLCLCVLLTACGGGDSSSGAGSTNVPGNVNQAAVGTYQGTTCVTVSLARQSVKQQESVRECVATTYQINANGRLFGGTTGGAGATNCTNPQPPTFVNGTTISNTDNYTCVILGEACNFERNIDGNAANQTLNIRLSGTARCAVSGDFPFVGTINAKQQRSKAPLQSQEGLNDSDLYINLIEQLL